MNDKMNDSKLTEEEEQLYDRQIRLWGMDAQNRLRNSKVLIIGVNGVSCEVIKNLVLTGINRIGLCDESSVTQEDIENNFLIPRTSIGENTARASKLRTENLNPRVIVNDYNHLPVEINEGNSRDSHLSIEEFDIVVCCISHTPSHKAHLWVTLNEICRKLGKLFFAMDSFGWFGLTFIDLGVHDFVKEEFEVQKPGEKSVGNVVKLIPQVKEFCRLGDVLKIQWNNAAYARKLKRMPKIQFIMLAIQQFVRENRRYASHDDDEDVLADNWARFADQHGLDRGFLPMDSFRECVGAGNVPINAVLGGLVTQEIIKAISRKNEPVGNFVLFNGVTCSADSTFIQCD